MLPLVFATAARLPILSITTNVLSLVTGTTACVLRIKFGFRALFRIGKKGRKMSVKSPKFQIGHLVDNRLWLNCVSVDRGSGEEAAAACDSHQVHHRTEHTDRHQVLASDRDPG